MEWIKAIDRLPPEKIKVIIKDNDGSVYVDKTVAGWNPLATDYEWLDESIPSEEKIRKDANKEYPFVDGKPNELAVSLRAAYIKAAKKYSSKLYSQSEIDHARAEAYEEGKTAGLEMHEKAKKP